MIPTQNETAPFVLVGANEQPGVPLIGKDRAFAALEVLQDTLVNPESGETDFGLRSSAMHAGGVTAL